jgi:hypothetical protein
VPGLRKLAFEPLEDRRMLSIDSPQIELFKISPALFVENQGQWADESVRFVHQGDGVNVAMTDAGPVFQVFRREPIEGELPPDSEFAPRDLLSDYRTEMLSFSASFVGASAVVPTGQDPAETQFNYFIGAQENWRSEVPAFEQVVYENLYSGVDLATWGQRSHLKYEFHVAPGADWQQIQIHYEGIAGLSLGDDGSLRVNLGGDWGELVDDVPYIYQVVDGQRVDVAGQFSLLDGHTYSFAITGDYDPGRELVIDPDLAWSTYLGGSSLDQGNGITVDSSGNVVVAGYTYSSGLFSGGFDPSFNGAYDAFVAKFSTVGSHLWSTYLGGGGGDGAEGVAVDSSGNILVTGHTYSGGWVTGGFDTEWSGLDDAFVVKLSPTGNHAWSTYLGVAGDNKAYGITADVTGNVLVVGSSAIVVKLTPGGGYLWRTYLGGNQAFGVAVDGSGNVFVTGQTNSSGWVSGGFDTSFNGSVDAFLVKLTSGGSPVWSTYIGGSGDDYGYAVSVDGGGNVLVTGQTGSSGWVSGGFDTSFNGSCDVFVTKVSTSGSHLWSTYLGGGGSDRGRGVALDGSGNVMVAGQTNSSGWVSGGFDTSFNGTEDAFVAKLSGGGSHLWSTYLGGGAAEWAGSVAVDGSGNVSVTGYTYSSGWVSGGFDTSFGGQYDAFVAMITGLGTPTDVDDTLNDAVHLGTLTIGSPISRLGKIGDGAYVAKDVDLYKFTLTQPGRLDILVKTFEGTWPPTQTPVDTYLRLFNANGQCVYENDEYAERDGLGHLTLTGSRIQTTVLEAGTYYVGISGVPNRNYAPSSLSGRVTSSLTGSYTLVLTATAGDAGTWSPQIALSVPDGYDGNAAPSVFGRYLTGTVVPTVNVPFTVTVTPSVGRTTQSVWFDQNFNNTQDTGEVRGAGESWTWTLDVSHDEHLAATGTHTLNVWAQDTTNAWSAATFTIDTLTAPAWVSNAISSTVVFEGSAGVYRLDVILTTTGFPSFNVPDWDIIKPIADALGVTTLFGLDLGIHAVVDLSLNADVTPSGVVGLGLVPNILGFKPFVPISPSLSINKSGGRELGTPEVDGWQAGVTYYPEGGIQGWKLKVPIGDLGDIIKLAGGRRISNSLLQFFTSQKVLLAGRGRPKTEYGWELDVKLALQDGSSLSEDLVWQDFGMAGHVELKANVDRTKQPKFFEIKAPPILVPNPLAIPAWVQFGVGFSVAARIEGVIEILPTGEVSPNASLSIAPTVSLSGTFEVGAHDMLSGGATGEIGIGIITTVTTEPGGPWIDAVDLDFQILGGFSVFVDIFGHEVTLWRTRGQLWHCDLLSWDPQNGWRAFEDPGNVMGEGGVLDGNESDWSAPVLQAVGSRVAMLFRDDDAVGVSQLYVQWRDEAGVWGTASPITSGNHYHGRGVLCLRPSGELQVVWLESRSDQSTYNSSDVAAFFSNLDVMTSTWNGSEWTVPVAVCTGGGSKGHPVAAYASTGAGQQGIVLWEEGGTPSDVGPTRIYGESWDGTQWIAMGAITTIAETGWNPGVAFDSDGDAVTVWLGGDNARPTVRWSRWDGSNWASTGVLSSGKMVRFPSVHRLADGRVLATWAELTDRFWALRSAVWDATSDAWGPIETIVEELELIDRPTVAVAPNGHVTVVFHGRSYHEDLFAYTRDFSISTAVWLPEQDLTGTGYVEWFPAVTYDAASKLVVRYVKEDILGTGDTSPSYFALDSNIAGGFQGSTLGLSSDLAVSYGAASIPTGPPVATSTSTVRIRVENVGWSNSPNAEAKLFLGNPASGGTLVDTRSVMALPPGTSGGVDFTWTPTSVGAYQFYVVLDSNNTVVELREDNNQASFAVGVVSRPTLALDPASDSGTKGDGWTADNTPTLTGTTAAGTTVAIYVDSQTSPFAQATVVGSAFTVTLPTLSNGPHTVWAQAFDAGGHPSPFSSPLALLIDAAPLVLDGTSGNDTIRLAVNATNPAMIDVFINNSTAVPNRSVAAADFWQWVVRGGGGNDQLIVDGISLQVNQPDAISDNTAVTIRSNGTLDLGRYTETVATFTLESGSLSNGTLNAASYTIKGGTVSATLGPGPIIKQTTGPATVTKPINATTVDVQAGQLTATSIVADTLVIGAGSSVVIAETVPPGSTASLATTSTTVPTSADPKPVLTPVTPVAEVTVLVTTAPSGNTASLATTASTTVPTPADPVPVLTEATPVAAIAVPVTTVSTESAFVEPLQSITPQPAATDAALAQASPTLPIATSPSPAQKARVLPPTAAPIATSASLDYLALLLAMERSATDLAAQRHLRALDAVLAERASFFADSPDAFAPARPVRRRMASV